MPLAFFFVAVSVDALPAPPVRSRERVIWLVVYSKSSMLIPYLTTEGNGVEYAIWFMAPASLCSGGMHSATAGWDCTTWQPGRSAQAPAPVQSRRRKH